MSLRLIQLRSADGVRILMHQAAAAGTTTDSMRMFLLGLKGGKPADGEIGVQPEWFYKGDGGEHRRARCADPLA